MFDALGWKAEEAPPELRAIFDEITSGEYAENLRRTGVEGRGETQNGKRVNNEAVPLFAAEYADNVNKMSLTITNESTTKAQALSNLKVIANKDLINYETGITAKINSEQRNKILSNAAVIKSLKNGFTSAQHNSVAAEIEKFWYHAKLVKSRSDRANDINIVSIKHFEPPVFFEKSEGMAYFTLKETLNPNSAKNTPSI